MNFRHAHKNPNCVVSSKIASHKSTTWNARIKLNLKLGSYPETHQEERERVHTDGAVSRAMPQNPRIMGSNPTAAIWCEHMVVVMSK